MLKLKEKIKALPWGYFMFAVTFIVIGLCFIIFTSQSIDTMCYVIGGLTIVAAAVNAVITLAKRERKFNFFFRIILCVFAVICGVVVMVSKETTLEYIVGTISLLLIIDASFKLQTVVVMKANKTTLWWVLIVFILLAYLGNAYLIKFYSVESPKVMVGLLGGLLVIDGVMNFLTPILLALVQKKVKKDTIEENKEVGQNEEE